METDISLCCFPFLSSNQALLPHEHSVLVYLANDPEENVSV